MATPEESMLNMAQQLLANLPVVLQVFQAISYILLVFFLGHLAIKGYRGNLKFYLAFPLKAGLGLASIIIGSTIGSYLKLIPIFNTGLLMLLQADLVIGGMISAFLLALGLYLFSYRAPVFKLTSIGKSIPVLDDRLGRIEATLFREGILKPGVKEAEAREEAEKAIAGYKAISAKMEDDFWYVNMKKGKKNALVIVDGYSGRVKSIVVKGIDIVRIGGMIVIAALIVFGVLTFTGFPNLSDDLYAFLGISESDVSGLGSLLSGPVTGPAKKDPSCVGVQALILSYGFDIVNNKFPPYSNSEVQAIIEQNSGSPVKAMYSITHEGKDVIVAVTEDSICSATQSAFCECLAVNR